MDRATMETLGALAQELDNQERNRQAQAVREALNELAGKDGYITTGAAAEMLGVSIPTVRRWAERRNLDGFETGTRLLVSRASVERLIRIRASLRALDEEGIPSEEEIERVRAPHMAGGGQRVA